MEKISVKIQTLEEAINGEGIFDPGKKPIFEATEVTVGILESGTVNHKTSLVLVLKLPDGSHATGQITANHLNMLSKILEGAEQRFANLRKERSGQNKT